MDLCHCGLTPLQLAVCKGDTGLVKELLHGGAEPNRANIFGTPLWAVNGEWKELVKLLIVSDADQNVATQEGKNPLYLAQE